MFKLHLRPLARRVLAGIRPRPPLLTSARRLGPVDRRRIAAKVRALGPWFHNMNLAKGVWTHPQPDGAGPDYPAWRWNLIKPLLPELTGLSCLDVGCSSGFFSLKMKELGAAKVLAVDHGEQVRAIEQARFAASSLGLEVEFQTLSVYDVAGLNRQFDLVLFLGVFYHLRHPMLALDALRKACTGTLLFQTITTPHQPGTYEACPPAGKVHVGLRSAELNQPDFPLLRFVEGGLDGDTSCWFVPSVEACLAMLRGARFKPERMVCPDAHEVIIRASCV